MSRVDSDATPLLPAPESTMNWLVDGTTAAIVKRLSESGAGAGESSVRSKVRGSVRGGDTGLNGGVTRTVHLSPVYWNCQLMMSSVEA